MVILAPSLCGYAKTSIPSGGRTRVFLGSRVSTVSNRAPYEFLRSSLLKLSCVGLLQSGPTTCTSLDTGRLKASVVTASPTPHGCRFNFLLSLAISAHASLRPSPAACCILSSRPSLPASLLFAGITMISPSTPIISP